METEHSFLFTAEIVLGIVICEGLAQFTLKKAAQNESITSPAATQLNQSNQMIRYVLIASVFYTLIACMLLIAYRTQGLGQFNIMWSMGSIILAFLSGSFFFGEKLDSNTGIAIVFAVLSLHFAYHRDKQSA
jgi:drug/metabolite transporter (DMT)-like permease